MRTLTSMLTVTNTSSSSLVEVKFQGHYLSSKDVWRSQTPAPDWFQDEVNHQSSSSCLTRRSTRFSSSSKQTLVWFDKIATSWEPHDLTRRWRTWTFILRTWLDQKMAYVYASTGSSYIVRFSPPLPPVRRETARRYVSHWNVSTPDRLWRLVDHNLTRSTLTLARFPLPELTARVNCPSWRVTGFNYLSTRPV